MGNNYSNGNCVSLFESELWQQPTVPSRKRFQLYLPVIPTTTTALKYKPQGETFATKKTMLVYQTWSAKPEILDIPARIIIMATRAECFLQELFTLSAFLSYNKHAEKNGDIINL